MHASEFSPHATPNGLAAEGKDRGGPSPKTSPSVTQATLCENADSKAAESGPEKCAHSVPTVEHRETAAAEADGLAGSRLLLTH